LLHYREDNRSALKKLAQKVVRSSYTLPRSSLVPAKPTNGRSMYLHPQVTADR
jgi:hypothetical protein